MKKRTGYLINRNGIYYAAWTVNGKKFMQTTGKRDKRQAQTRLDEIMAPFLLADKAKTLQHIAGEIEGTKSEIARLEDKQHPPLTLKQAWSAYEKAANRPDSGPATLNTYALQWGCFISWVYGKPPKGKAMEIKGAHPEISLMRDVSKEIAGEYAAHMTGKGVTANTFNKHVRVCELVFRVLRIKARITDNPFTEITRKKLLPQSHRELTTEELREVCQKADGELRVMLALGLYLGARLGDAALMEWGSADLKKGLVRYTPRKTARRSGKELTVPLHPVLIGILSETPPPERKGYILPGMAKLYNERGPYAVARIVQAHFEDCDIKTTREGKGVRKVTSAGFHSLRHSAVSLLREAGAPLSVTMAIVGHSSLAMHDTYTHAGEAALRQAVASLPTVIGDPKTVKALPARATLSLGDFRSLLESMNAKNWQQVRDEVISKISKG